MPDINNSVADLVTAVGSVRFAATLMDAFKRLVVFDQACILVFDNKLRRPFCLASVWTHKNSPAVLDYYIAKYFIRSEILERLIAQRTTDRQFSLLTYSKNEIKDPLYRQELYDDLDIQYDLALFDQTNDLSFFLELFRSADRAAFTDADIEVVREFWPIALACINKHARLLQVLPDTDPTVRLRLDFLTQTFRDCLLTPRESEICSYIVSGHSSLAISLHLNISLNTVATLRRRAYRRLNISSQSELFSVCLHHMATFVRKQAVGYEAFRCQIPSILQRTRSEAPALA
jgi:DNA-binding CsgD family transcriptional regulator